MANVNMANSKTTIFGALAAVFLALSVVPQLVAYQGVAIALSAVCTALSGYFAKDATTGSAPNKPLG